MDYNASYNFTSPVGSGVQVNGGAGGIISSIGGAIGNILAGRNGNQPAQPVQVVTQQTETWSGLSPQMEKAIILLLVVIVALSAYGMLRK